MADELDAIALHEADSVATALRAIPKGEDFVVSCPDKQITLRAAEDIPIYHKVALADLAADAAVHKHGHWIGRTTAAIAAGTLVHVHNMTGRKTDNNG